MSKLKPLRMKAQPHEYLEAIVRRVKRLNGIHRASATCFGARGNQKAHLRVTYNGEGCDGPDPELREQVDILRREFSAAFPEWGISVDWLQHSPYRVRPVVTSSIEQGYLVQTLDCGHRVRGERIRTKRVCSCCSVKP